MTDYMNPSPRPDAGRAIARPSARCTAIVLAALLSAGTAAAPASPAVAQSTTASSETAPADPERPSASSPGEGPSAGEGGADTPGPGAAPDAYAPETTRPSARSLDAETVRSFVELDDGAIFSGLEADALEGMRIENAAREPIGEVESVLGPPGGPVRAFSVVVDEGWFGDGWFGDDDRSFVVPAEMLALDHGRRFLTTVLSRDAVRGLPRWPQAD